MKSTCCHRHEAVMSRREALVKSGCGLGAIAVAYRVGRFSATVAVGGYSWAANPL